MAVKLGRYGMLFFIVSLPCLLLAVDPPAGRGTAVQLTRGSKGKAFLGSKPGTASLDSGETDSEAVTTDEEIPATTKKGLLRNARPGKKKSSGELSGSWAEALKSKETEKAEPASTAEDSAEESPAPLEKAEAGANKKKTPIANPRLRGGKIRGVSDAGTALPNAIPLAGGEALAPQISTAWKHQGNFVLGQQTTCQLVVKNQGKQSVQRVALDVSLAAGAKLVSTQPSAEESPSCLTWQLEGLAPEEERTFEVTFVPQERGEFPATAALRVTSACQTQFFVEEPLLKLSVQAPKTSVLGNAVTHEVTVTNPGTGAAHHVTLEADLPAGLVCNGTSKVSLPVGDVKPGETKTLSLELKSTEKGPQKFTLTALGDAQLRQVADVETEILAPALKLEAQGPALRYVNRKARYQFSVTNTGNSPAQDVQIVGMIPTGFQVVEAGQSGKVDPEAKTVSWTVAQLAEGEIVTMSLEAVASEIGTQSYLLKATAAHGAEAMTTCETKVEGISSIILELRDQDDPVETKVDTSYELHVRNDGNKTAKDVKITCDLPPEMQFISGSGPTEVLSDNGKVTLAPLLSLEPQKEAIYKLNVRSVKTGNAKLRVKLTSPSLQKPVTAEELTRIYAD